MIFNDDNDDDSNNSNNKQTKKIEVSKKTKEEIDSEKPIWMNTGNNKSISVRGTIISINRNICTCTYDPVSTFFYNYLVKRNNTYRSFINPDNNPHIQYRSNVFNENYFKFDISKRLNTRYTNHESLIGKLVTFNLMVIPYTSNKNVAGISIVVNDVIQ